MTRRNALIGILGTALATTAALLYHCGLITEEEKTLFRLNETLPLRPEEAPE